MKTSGRPDLSECTYLFVSLEHYFLQRLVLLLTSGSAKRNEDMACDELTASSICPLTN